MHCMDKYIHRVWNKGATIYILKSYCHDVRPGAWLRVVGRTAQATLAYRAIVACIFVSLINTDRFSKYFNRQT